MSATESITIQDCKDLCGHRFGRWLVVSLVCVGRRRGWLCRCDCGTERVVREDRLKSGRSLSCGCFHREISAGIFRTHGLSKRSEYRIWLGMRRRCSDKNHPSYKDYGARGIKVCQQWEKSFVAFYSDVGQRPTSDHSLDRIDSNKDYEPGNVRWAVKHEQVRNTRRNTFVVIDGERMVLEDACAKFGQRTNTVCKRLAHGWDIEKSLRTPPNPSYQRNKKPLTTGV